MSKVMSMTLCWLVNTIWFLFDICLVRSNGDGDGEIKL